MGNRLGKTRTDLDDLSHQTDITSERLSAMMEMFNSVSGTGYIDHERFLQVLADAGLTSELAELWWRVFDKDNDGRVDFREYVITLASKSSADVRTKAEMAFRIFDRNGDQKVTLFELENIIASVLKQQYPNVESSTIRQVARDKALMVFDYADQNADNFITLQEWLTFAENNEEAQEFMKVVDHSVRTFSGLH
ncbi:MAG: hypothetical protein MHM6MM_004081 [Cercozoa sp. M6MM]